MRVVERVLRGVVKVFSFLSLLFVVAMMLLGVLDVVLRIFFKAPIIGATELTQMMMVGMVLALGAGVLGDENITVDFVMDFFPQRTRWVVELITSVITIGVCLLISYEGIKSAIYSHSYNYAYSLLGVPEWPFLVVLSVGFLGGVVAIIAVMIRLVYNLCGKNNDSKRPEESGKEELQ